MYVVVFAPNDDYYDNGKNAPHFSWIFEKKIELLFCREMM